MTSGEACRIARGQEHQFQASHFQRREQLPEGSPSNAAPRVLIAVATYNERENLPRLVEKIFAAMPQAHVVVVDDGSPDGTGEWCEGESALDPRLRCIQRGAKLGLGTAAVLGMQVALDERYDILVNLDADHSHDPQSIPDLVRLITHGDKLGQRVDVAVGSRYVEGGAIHGWPLSRRFTSRMVNGMARLMFRLPVRDCSGSFRAYRVATLAQMGLFNIRSSGYSFYEEVLWRLRVAGARFAEIPITFSERELGQTKVNFGEIVGSMTQLVKLGAGAIFGKE